MAAVREALRGLDLSEKLHPPRRLLSAHLGAKNSGATAGGRAEDSALGATLSPGWPSATSELLGRPAPSTSTTCCCARCPCSTRTSEVRERYRARFRYVLVDEYQDTNRAQYDARPPPGGRPQGNVTVVGDEDQSIYSWRGADIRNILDFERDFPGARVLRLEENYRSTQAILDAASALVAHNRAAQGQDAAGGQGRRRAGAPAPGGRRVRGGGVGGRRRSPPPARPRRAAVLFRMNAQSRLFEEALLRQGLPYLVVGGVGFYERKEVKDVLAYLRLVLNPRRRRGPAAGAQRAGPRHRRRAPWTRSSGRRPSAGSRCGRPWARWWTRRCCPRGPPSPCARFRELVEQLRAEAAGLTVKGLIERVLAPTGYAAALAQEDTQESQDRLENLAELLSAAADYEARSEAAQPGRLPRPDRAPAPTPTRCGTTRRSCS